MNSFWPTWYQSSAWNSEFYRLALEQYIIPKRVKLDDVVQTTLKYVRPRMIALAERQNALLRYFIGPNRHEVLDDMVDCAMMEEYDVNKDVRDS